MVSAGISVLAHLVPIGTAVPAHVRATQASPLRFVKVPQIVRSLEAATMTGSGGGILRSQPQIDWLLH
jgi:hypothetical protein